MYISICMAARNLIMMSMKLYYIHIYINVDTFHIHKYNFTESESKNIDTTITPGNQNWLKVLIWSTC